MMPSRHIAVQAPQNIGLLIDLLIGFRRETSEKGYNNTLGDFDSEVKSVIFRADEYYKTSLGYKKALPFSKGLTGTIFSAGC
jgi:hypothetical protein